MSEVQDTNEVRGGQDPTVVDATSKFARKVVNPTTRSIVPSPTQAQAAAGMISADDLQQAIVLALTAAEKVKEQKARREAKAAAKAAGGAASSRKGKGTREPSIAARFIQASDEGVFGECAAEQKEDSMLVRRWNGSFWELLTDTAGESEAMDWLMTNAPEQVSKAKSSDCWKSLNLYLYKRKPFKRAEPEEEHVVIPLLDGYLHVTKDRAWLEEPNKALGLTFQVKAKSGTAPGKEFVPQTIPSNSLFGRYLDSSLPDLELRSLIQEQCAMSFVPNTHQTVAWWVGEGGAGKGTLSKLIEAFHHKVATLDLHKLSEPHHLEALVDASLIRVDEVSQKGIWGEKEFKSIVSGDVFMINPKHKKNYTHRTSAYWIITTNQPPLIRDESDGVRRRIIPVPWLSSARARGFSERNLDQRIMRNESHLVLGWVVEGLQRYLRRGGPVPQRELPEPVKEMMRKIHHSNDNVEAWFEACEICPADPDFKIQHTKKEIYKAYQEFTENNGGTVLKEESFWIRFWRRPGLRSSGVVEMKTTGITESGTKGRLMVIKNLALTPQEVARQKLRELDKAVIERGDYIEDLALVDPFGGDPNATSDEIVKTLKYNENDLAERARLYEMMGLSS